MEKWRNIFDFIVRMKAENLPRLLTRQSKWSVLKDFILDQLVG